MMNIKQLNKDHIDIFFRDLFERCEAEDVYSVKETVAQMGVDYEQVEEWASKDAFWDHILQLCRDECAMHAESDGMLGKIPASEMMRYSFECDDEMIAMYPTKEAQEKCIKDAKKEEQAEKIKALKENAAIRNQKKQCMQKSNQVVRYSHFE